MTLGLDNIANSVDVSTIPEKSLIKFIHTNNREVWIYRKKYDDLNVINNIPAFKDLDNHTRILIPKNKPYDSPYDDVINMYDELENQWLYVVDDVSIYYLYFKQLNITLNYSGIKMIRSETNGFITISDTPSKLIVNSGHTFTRIDDLEIYLDTVRKEANTEFVNVIHKVVSSQCSECYM